MPAFETNSEKLNGGSIARSAGLLLEGKLVAFPTETVYGLGANALNPDAVARIFVAKERPTYNPLIVHVADTLAAKALVLDWPEAADLLSEVFWPGALTLVLLKRGQVPDTVTGGGPTVALRVPSHPVAHALLRSAGIPIAAPSANRSGRLSPTTSDHVLRSLYGRIDLVLDGGPTSGGIESTVVSLVGGMPRLLRPGLIGSAEIEAVVGPIERMLPLHSNLDSAALLSPGMLDRHYAPRTPLELTADGPQRVEELGSQGLRVGWLRRSDTLEAVSESDRVIRVEMRRDAAGYAAQVYAELHALDARGVDRIVVDAVPETEEWLAVRDRLQRASVPE